jgi:hypothetical protein
MGKDASVDENGIADDGDDVVLSETTGEGPSRPKRFDALHDTVHDHLGLDRVGVGDRSREKVQVPFERHVPQVQLHVHELVVAIECMDTATGSAGLSRQVFEKRENLELVASAVQYVSRLNDDEVSTDPLIVLFDGTGKTKCGKGRGKVPVKIPNGDDSVCFRKPRRYIKVQRLYVERRFTGTASQDRSEHDE